MKKWNKGVAVLTAATMLTGIPASMGNGMSVAHAEEARLLASLDFENLTAGQDIETDLVKANGEYEIADSYPSGGQALYLNGSGQFLRVTGKDGQSLLTGQKEITVSYEAKIEKASSANWALYAAAEEKSPSYGKERYIGIMQKNGTLTAERYHNTGSRPASANTAASNDWIHVDVVLSESDTAIYINGEEKSREASSYAVDGLLGDNSILQIGKANWESGEYFQGWMDNFRIYDKALSEEEIQGQYAEYALGCDAEALTLPEEISRSVKLPSTGQSGLTKISWTSEKPEILADDGTVTRPDEDTKVTMTAVIEANGKKLTKEITVTVLKKNPQEDLEMYREELTLNAGFVSEDLELPGKLGDAKITWETSDKGVITKDGKITRKAEENQEVTLTAKIQVDGADSTAEKEFKLTVLAEGKDLVSYISSTPATGQKGGMKIAAEGEEGYEALHKDQPVLYTSLGSKCMAAPQIFRKADGSFAAVAADGGENGTIIIYESEDLTTYSEGRLTSIPGVNTIEKIQGVYDSTEELYKVFIREKGGRVLLTTSEDLESFREAQESSFEFEEPEGIPEDAVSAAKAALTQAEYDAVVSKFTNPKNTKLTGLPKDIEIQAGEDYQEQLEENSQVKAAYSDGTEKTYSVRWNQGDLAKVRTDRAGTYTVRGTVGGSAYYTEADEPLIEERADPFITYNEDDGYYYFTASYPMNGSGDKDGYDRLILRRAKTISGLAEAEEVVIWDENQDDGSGATGFDSYGRFIWAPELHKIGGSWYFISTAGDDPDGGNFGIRPFMLKCENPEDMMNPESWGKPERVKPVAGDNCMNAMSLDMTHFTAGGTDYLAWADVTQGDSSIYIATIDPANPTQLTSKCTIITKPEYSWELVNNRVDEGPAVIQKDGKVYLAFSASGTGMEYCVGLLSADAKDDLTDAANWEKTPYPILTSSDFHDEVSGPGHNSFTIDEYGNPVIVYHARPTKTHTTAGGVHNGDPLYDPCRHCYVKPVFFDQDGMPILNLSENEFAEDTEVSIQITVKGEEASMDPILEYNFDEEYEAGKAKDSRGENDAVLTEGASYVKDDAYGQVLYLDGNESEGGHNSYLEFPEGFFDGRNSLTISMDVNEVTRTGNYFTFGVGQDNQKYLFLKTAPTYTKLAVTTESYTKEAVADRSAVYPNNSREWINVKMVVTPVSISLYQDGKLIAENNQTKIQMSDLGESLKAYLGKSFYSGDKYFRGYFDNVKVYDWAMTDDEVKTVTAKEEKERKETMQSTARVAEEFAIPNGDNIKGNITLPSEKDGVKITWESSDEQVISTKEKKNEGYDKTPAGMVTRQDKDTRVTLKAVFSKDGEEAVTKKYEVTVKAKPEQAAEEDYAGYLFVHFTGSEQNASQEQTYFSLSKDGLNWEDLNGNAPVLTSTFGESGLRDHYIARSKEGDKFYMIATDLSIYNNNSWMEAGGSGSHSIVVWESDDLVTWSEPWLSEIAPEGAGCTWAPEFIYDEITGEYVVYWASTTLKVDEDENITEEYENHTIYYCKTRDFRTYTEPQVYHAGGKDAQGKTVKVIDSTMIENDGTYYRYTKNESKGIIEIDKSDSVLGEFTNIESETLSKDLPNAKSAVEGPIIFKLNQKTDDGKDQWCLMVDRYARGEGYYPLITTDLESGEFTMLEDSQFHMPSKYRHGYVMPVTAAEYSALQRTWGDESYVDTYQLEQAIRDAEAVDPEKYTEDSYANLQAAITAAKEALQTVTSTAEADAAASELQAAIDALVEVEPENPDPDPGNPDPDPGNPDPDPGNPEPGDPGTGDPGAGNPGTGDSSSGDGSGTGNADGTGSPGAGNQGAGGVKTADTADTGMLAVLAALALGTAAAASRRNRKSEER